MLKLKSLRAFEATHADDQNTSMVAVEQSLHLPVELSSFLSQLRFVHVALTNRSCCDFGNFKKTSASDDSKNNNDVIWVTAYCQDPLLTIVFMPIPIIKESP